MDEKTCKKCNVTKPITEFKTHKVKDKIYYTSRCRDCINEDRRENYKTNEELQQRTRAKARQYREEHKEELKEKRKDYFKEYNKKYYHENKEYFQNYKKTEKYKEQQKEYKDEIIEIDGEVKSRKAVLRKKYRENHKEDYLKNKRIHDKTYRDSHKEEIKKWKQDNIELIRKERREYHNKRVKADPLYKFEKQIRGVINSSFKRKKYSKKSHTYEIIGLEFDELYSYLLETFKKNYGYDWDGIEDVHIDHIIPLATAKSEEEIITLCYYTNLQLLKAKDNLEKKDSLDWNLK